MAYVEIIRLIIDLLEPWTKGVTGLTGIPPPSLFGVVLEGMIGKYYFFCILAATILLITFKLEKSSTGLIWQGIGLNSDLCESAGINTYMNKIAAFAVSSFIAGIVGSYYAHYMGVMFSTTFGWVWGANIAFYNFIGGTGSFFGPIVGAVFLTGISEPLRGVAEYEMFFFALAMVLVMIFLPGGIISLPKRIGSIIRKPSVDKTGI
jgi:branched-chain amino acid transport system permease protein